MDKLESLFEAVHDIEVDGIKVKVRELTASEILDEVKENAQQKTFRYIHLSMIDPIIPLEKVKSLPLKRLNKIQKAIMDINGMGKESETKKD